MTITVYCFASVCSVALSNVGYLEHGQATWIDTMSKKLLVKKEHATLTETKMKAQYNKDLVTLLDYNVYDVVTPTLTTVKNAVDKAVKEGKYVRECYMRTEELMENEAIDLFDTNMRDCVHAFMQRVYHNIRKIPDIIKNFTNIMNEVNDIRADCANASKPIDCVKQKIESIQYGKFSIVSKDLDDVVECSGENYKKLVDDAYNCTSGMRTNLEKINESALRQGLACVDNPDMAEYPFSRYFDVSQ